MIEDNTPPSDISEEADKSLENSWSSLREGDYRELNQFEMQYDDLKNGTNTWAAAIDAIKSKYPKLI